MMQESSDIAPELLTRLLENAANNTSEGITISSMSLPDRPLIYINEGFERLTGYPKSEVLGKNCRFLQGENTDPEAVSKLRNAINKGESCTVELVNYRKDGKPFWNRLSVTPLKDASGKVTHYVGVQSDITELKKTKERLETANARLRTFHTNITRDLERAKAAQEFLLPSRLPQSERVRFAAKFQPMAEIGGDFFDVIELQPEVYGILIADVTGHGIPAALITFMSSTTFRNSANGQLSTARTMSLTNKGLYRKMPDDAFVTMFYAVYNANNGVLTYTQAGHPEAYILRASSREIIPLTTGDIFLGILPADEISFSEKTVDLMPGDKVILYTDAITDVIDFSPSDNDIVNFRQFLNSQWGTPLPELFEAIYRFGLNLSQTTAYPDDFTLIGFEVF